MISGQAQFWKTSSFRTLRRLQRFKAEKMNIMANNERANEYKYTGSIYTFSIACVQMMPPSQGKTTITAVAIAIILLL